MSVRIRLTRVGRKKDPSYRVVVADSRSARDGRFIEILGYYHPLTNPVDVKVDKDRVLKWLKDGAVPSDTVRSILRKEGILKEFHLLRKPAPKVAKSA